MLRSVPEGDTLHRAAARLQALVGQRLEVVAPHPRGAAVAARIDGRVLDDVRAVGKNLLLTFEGGVVVRSHLRMTGRWQVRPRAESVRGRPWLVLRGTHVQGVLWNGPVLEVGDGGIARLGPDILAEPLDVDAILRNLRLHASEQPVGEALLDQRLVAGIGNVWRAEALWEARVSPWVAVAELADGNLRATLQSCAALMRRSAAGERVARRVYRRTGRPCARCAEPIRAHGQGDANRIAYWCPRCQPGGDAGEPVPTP